MKRKQLGILRMNVKRLAAQLNKAKPFKFGINDLHLIPITKAGAVWPHFFKKKNEVLRLLSSYTSFKTLTKRSE